MGYSNVGRKIPCPIWATATKESAITASPVPGLTGDRSGSGKAESTPETDTNYGVVVLSLCDGIGAVTQALAQMDIKSKSVYIRNIRRST